MGPAGLPSAAGSGPEFGLWSAGAAVSGSAHRHTGQPTTSKQKWLSGYREWRKKNLIRKTKKSV